MVIGKSGSAIKEIRDKTGSGIQINPKQGSPEAQRSVERVITISNTNQAKLEHSLELALSKVASDPNHSSYPNLSYAGSGPIHNESSNSEPVNFVPPFVRGGPPFGGGGGLPPPGHPPQGHHGHGGPPIPLFPGGGGGSFGGGGMGLGAFGVGGPAGGLPVAAQPGSMQGKMFGKL